MKSWRARIRKKPTGTRTVSAVLTAFKLWLNRTMARVKVKLRELRNADVRYISLVDRAATRIPIRVTKSEQGDSEMDLTRIFKQETVQAEPKVTDITVYAQKTPEATEQVRQSIADAGFSTERVQKSE